MQLIEQQPRSIERRIDALAHDAGADRFGAFQIVHRRNIFTPVRELRPDGMTIEEIVASVPTLPERFWQRGVVTIDRCDGLGSFEIPRENWRLVRPRTNGPVPIEVSLWLPPEGDGARNILSIVAAIAIVVATAYIAGPAGVAFFSGLGLSATAAGVAASAAAATFAVGASLAMRALSPPPSIGALSTGGSVDNPLTPASLAGNVLRPGSPIPHVRGRRKVFPPIVVKPLVELVGDDEYATAVFGLSGAHDLDNIRADGASVTEMDDLTYETKEGHSSDTAITLVTRQSKTDSSAIVLSQHKIDITAESNLADQTTPLNSVPVWHQMRADAAPDEIWINLRWPTGLFDGDGPTDEIITPVRVRMRAVGDTNWIRLPEIHFAYRKQEPFQKDIRIKWGTAPALPTPKSTRCPYAAYSAVPMRFSDTGNTQVGDWNTFSLSAANDASTSTYIQKSGSTASMYAGFRHATITRRAVKLILLGTAADGMASSANVTVEWWGKTTTGAVASSTDGVLIATSGSIADSSNQVELTSSDQTTQYYAQWFRIVGSASASYQISQADFYDDGDWSWLSHSHFYSALNLNPAGRVMRDSTIGTTQVRNIALYADRADVYLDAGTFPQGDYEIEIMRGTAVKQAAFTETEYRMTEGFDTLRYADLFKWHHDGGTEYEVPRNMGNVQLQIQRQRLSLIWNTHPLPDAPGNLALIAVKVKNRQVNQIAADAALYVNDWNGSAWATQSTTANPAAHVHDILAGPLNADPVPEELIDSTSLVAWRTRCTSEGREINAVLEGASADVVAQLAAGCGFARVRQSETFGVIQDKDRSLDSPVQTFTPRNSRGYHFEKPFVRLPSGFRCIYADSANDYMETELLVEDPDGDFGGRYEEMRYDGLVTAAKVQERALFDLKQARRRMATHSFESNGQAIKCQRGDLIGLNHPILQAQMGAGYVREVLTSGSNVTGLVLDGTVPVSGSDGFFSGPDSFIDDLYGDGLWGPIDVGAVIRLHDGEGDLTAEITTDVLVDESRTITFVTPIAGPVDGLDRDCLVTVGRLGEERLRLILGEIQPKAGPSYPATLVAVDEAPELWA